MIDKLNRVAWGACLALFFAVAAASAILSAQPRSERQYLSASSGPVASATSATPSPTPPGVRFRFLVVDEKNHSVADVAPAEVSVSEDGVAQTVKEFSRDDSMVSYGLLIDNSGSMRPVLDLIVRQGERFVKANRTGDEVFVQRFVSANRIEILEDFTSDQSALADALSGMYIEGGQTALIDAIYSAAEHAARRSADGSRRPALVVFTDGEDRSSRHKKEELLKLLRETGVQVFVVGLTNLLDSQGGLISRSPRDSATRFLEQIAAESGGRAFFPVLKGRKNGPDDLGAAVQEIVGDLQAQYVVTYLPGHEADGKFHKVQLRVADAPGRPKRKVIARPGYLSPGVPGAEAAKPKP